MNFTTEQEEIIDCDLSPGQTLKVLAFAGTGKTTTLEAYTRKRPRIKFLYVAFNKSVQLEAERRFPPNVTARTSHSLAFRAKGWPHKDRLVPGFKANQVMAALELDRFEDARFVQDTLLNYLVSADPKVEVRHIPGNARAFYSENRLPMPDLVSMTNRLGRLMCTGDHPDIGMLHDGYLKLFQLSRPLLDYDCILLDEAQDINPVTADLILSQIQAPQIPNGQLRNNQEETGRATQRPRRPSLILVGDVHQQIYSFRGAGDSFKKFQADHTHALTQSFRFDTNVARVANMVLSRFKKEKRQLLGTPLPDKPIWNPQVHTVIARTNAGLFDKAVSLVQKHIIGFSGGLGAVRLDRLGDVCCLRNREAGRIRDPFLKGFSEFSALKTYARRVEDVEILAQCAVVEKYGSRLPFLLDKIREKAVAEDKADILLTTAHRAKGMEWPCVLLMDDFTPLVKEGALLGPGSADPDEFNLVYVAMTRAKTRLRFSKGSDIPEFIRLSLKQAAGSGVRQFPAGVILGPRTGPQPPV